MNKSCYIALLTRTQSVQLDDAKWNIFLFFAPTLALEVANNKKGFKIEILSEWHWIFLLMANQALWLNDALGT